MCVVGLQRSEIVYNIGEWIQTLSLRACGRDQVTNRHRTPIHFMSAFHEIQTCWRTVTTQRNDLQHEFTVEIAVGEKSMLTWPQFLGL